MSKTIEPKNYTQEQLEYFAESYIRADHNTLAQHEQKAGIRLYETFGEWKKEHPTHELAQYTFPEDEYIQVIGSAAHLHYMKIKYPPKTFNEITIGSTVNEITL